MTISDDEIPTINAAMNYTDRYNVPSLITLPEYVFHRLYQLNCKTVFGVPNYSTAKLFPSLAAAQLQWIQTINQLNTSFAADAYGRVNGLSCYITSESAELGHANGFFGSFCEYVPILQLVVLEQSHDLERLIGDVSIFHDIVDDPAEIDFCLQTVYWGKRPGYLGLRSLDIEKRVPSDSLNFNVCDQHNLAGSNELISSTSHAVQNTVNQILSSLYKSRNPLIVVDALIDRYDFNGMVQKFLTDTQIPFVTTLMSKAAVDEGLPNFVGTFLGTMSQPIVRECLENADLVVVLGCMIDNFKNSYCRYTYKSKNLILIWNDRVKLDGSVTPDVPLHKVLPSLLNSVQKERLPQNKPVRVPDMVPRVDPQPVTFLRQEYLWFKISTWLQEGDIIISESGTSALGLLQQRFPNNTKLVSQAIWNSSGYSVGACLGILAAYRDKNDTTQSHRVIMFVGDGSLQFTFQELSTIITQGFKPYVFVINNQGYSVDRTLNRDKTHLNATYFDIQQWELLRIPSLFHSAPYFKRKCMSVGELNNLCSDKQFNDAPDQLKMVELILPTMDVVSLLLESRDDSDEEEHSHHVQQPPTKRIRL